MTEEPSADENNVVELDDHRPHVNIRTEDGVIHVYPLVFFQNIVNGTLPIDTVEPLVLRALVSDWLGDLINNAG